MKASCLVLRGSECTLSSSEARDPKPLSLPTSLPSSAQVTLGQGTGTEQVCVYVCQIPLWMVGTALGTLYQG